LGYPQAVATITISEVRFIVPSNDHTPLHVHALIGESRFIIDMHPQGIAVISSRKGSRKPPNFKASDLTRALTIAGENHATLIALCKKVHALRPDEPSTKRKKKLKNKKGRS